MILIEAKGPYLPNNSNNCCSVNLGLKLPKYKLVVFGSPVSCDPNLSPMSPKYELSFEAIEAAEAEGKAEVGEHGGVVQGRVKRLKLDCVCGLGLRLSLLLPTEIIQLNLVQTCLLSSYQMLMALAKPWPKLLILSSLLLKLFLAAGDCLCERMRFSGEDEGLLASSITI